MSEFSDFLRGFQSSVRQQSPAMRDVAFVVVELENRAVGFRQQVSVVAEE
jgi:hypothetical protein